jgi:hypothetical protein
MPYLPFTHLEMTETQEFFMAATKGITHLNIHAKTTATMGQQESFRSMWFTHTPSAARYALFAQLCRGSVCLK